MQYQIFYKAVDKLHTVPAESVSTLCVKNRYVLPHKTHRSKLSKIHVGL